MNKIYAVYHWWEETYYNATQWKKELICVFDSLEKAEEFKEKYGLPYDNTPWALQEGQIEIKELPTTYDETKFKWLRKPEPTQTEPEIEIDNETRKKFNEALLSIFFGTGFKE